MASSHSDFLQGQKDRGAYSFGLTILRKLGCPNKKKKKKKILLRPNLIYFLNKAAKLTKIDSMIKFYSMNLRINLMDNLHWRDIVGDFALSLHI